MNNFGYTGAKPSIDMGEISSVREMIFSRAKEKSASLAAEKEENMTASLQNDVMNQARTSVTGSRIKPFGGLTQSTSNISAKSEPVVEESTKPNVQPLKHNVSTADNSVYTASIRDDVMNSARNQYSRKTSLMESLNFLNTQAAIRLANKTHSKIV